MKISNLIQAGSLGCLVFVLSASGARAGIDPSWWSFTPASGNPGTVSISSTMVTITGGNASAGDTLNYVVLTIPSTLTSPVYAGFDVVLNAEQSAVTGTYYDTVNNQSGINLGSGNSGYTKATTILPALLQPGSQYEFDLINNTATPDKMAGLLQIDVVPEPAMGPWAAAFLAFPVIGSLLYKRWRGKSLVEA